MDAASKLFDMGARIEHIIWIPGAVADSESLPAVFKDEFVSDFIDFPYHPIMEQLPVLKSVTNSLGEDCDFREVAVEVSEALLTTKGFLVQAATPVRRYHEDGSSSSSWGHYHTGWLYAERDDDILTVVTDWVETKDIEFKAQSKAETAI